MNLKELKRREYVEDLFGRVCKLEEEGPYMKDRQYWLLLDSIHSLRLMYEDVWHEGVGTHHHMCGMHISEYMRWKRKARFYLPWRWLIAGYHLRSALFHSHCLRSRFSLIGMSNEQLEVQAIVSDCVGEYCYSLRCLEEVLSRPLPDWSRKVLLKKHADIARYLSV